MTVVPDCFDDPLVDLRQTLLDARAMGLAGGFTYWSVQRGNIRFLGGPYCVVQVYVPNKGSFKRHFRIFDEKIVVYVAIDALGIWDIPPGKAKAAVIRAWQSLVIETKFLLAAKEEQEAVRVSEQDMTDAARVERVF